MAAHGAAGAFGILQRISSKIWRCSSMASWERFQGGMCIRWRSMFTAWLTSYSSVFITCTKRWLPVAWAMASWKPKS
jgi:hypothetical protein